MTYIEIDTALRNLDPPIGWSPLESRATPNPPTEYCNRSMCSVYAASADRAGLTADALAVMVEQWLAGDTGPLEAVLA